MKLIKAMRGTRDIYDAEALKFNFIEDETLDWIKIIGERYRNKKKELNVLDYDDLLVLWLKLLEEYPPPAPDQREGGQAPRPRMAQIFSGV